jgi:hypothetical protein
VSRRSKVVLAFGILAGFGISVSLAIIAIGGGFSVPLTSFLSPPSSADLWTVGENIHPGTEFRYLLTALGGHNSPWSSLVGPSSLINATVTVHFVRSEGNLWNASFLIENGTTSKSGTMLLSKQQLTNASPVSRNFGTFYLPIESSLLEIRDIDLDGPKYLAIGAEWNSLTIGPIGSTVSAKILDKEKIQTPAGAFTAYVLGYTIGVKPSRIWLSHDIPLPVKAEVYNAQNELQYKFTLINAKV